MAEPEAFDLRRDRMAVATVAGLLAAFALRAVPGLDAGGLSLDEASTFLVSGRPLLDVLTLPITFHAQPPLYYLALHGWLRVADSEPSLRLLSMLLVIAAAATVLTASWLSPAVRVITVGVMLLSDYGLYLAGLIRPYALVMWLALWSTLLFWSIVVHGARSIRVYTAYVAVTTLMAYALAMGSGLLLSEGLCACVAIAVAWRRGGVAAAWRRHGRTVIALALVGVACLPYVIAVSALQAQVGQWSWRAAAAAALNPRYFVSGPLYLLAMPFHLGLVAAAMAAYAAWMGLVQRDAGVGVLCAIIAIQIGMTHGLLEGRSAFAFRYLAPAYPAACLMAGIGAARLVGTLRRGGEVMAACAACVLAGAIVFAQTRPATVDSPLRQIARDLAAMPGPKVVFFEIGWSAQPFAYETRHDPSVRVMSNPGPGWGAGGQTVTADYVGAILAEEFHAPVTLIYEVAPSLPTSVFAGTFVPAVVRHGCARIYDRAVEAGERMFGYACHGR